MSHHHGHDHGHAKGKRLLITIILNLMITLAQVIGGLLAGSLSLLSDAAHNFSDVIALVISWLAEKLSKRKQSNKQTFGYKRAEVIAAMINVVTIIVIAVNILIEGIQRLYEPVAVTGTTVMLLAGLSIVLNGLSVLLIKSEAKHSMNMRSAYLHLFSDMLTSIAVLLGGLAMYVFDIYWIDGLIAIGIAVYLIKTSMGLLLETLKVLMQFTPDGVNLSVIKNKIESHPLVMNLHHVHVWQLVDDEIHFEGHIDFAEDIRLSEVNVYLNEIKKILHDEFGIEHCTLEAEYQKCTGSQMIGEC